MQDVNRALTESYRFRRLRFGGQAIRGSKTGLIDLFGTYVRNFVSLETDARMYNWITYGSLYLNVK